MILSDLPIETRDADKLGRTPLATKVADLIQSVREQSSFVIGIEGEWGSGKTSFINLVLEELEQHDGLIVVNFNPWNFIGQNELIADFFASVLAAIKDSVPKSVVRSVHSYTSKLQVSFDTAVSIPLIGSLRLGKLRIAGHRTLREERDKIDRELGSLNKKILIVIDDIDRLDKNDTRLIMKLVKMTANFPNTVFLLAYDRPRVVERLQEEGWPGEEYLKKIVQVSFTLPTPGRKELLDILDSDLNETLKKVYGRVELENEEQKHWNQFAGAGFGDLFKTIRDIKRFISSLRLNWSIMGKDDINLVDFIGIESIRVFAPGFYSAIGSNKALFTGTESLYIGLPSTDDNAAREARYKELLEKAPENIRTIVDKICKVLFPQLDFHTHYVHEWQEEWRSERRICADERFNFYFKLGIPEGAVSEGEVTNILATLDDQDNFSKNILRFKGEGRLKALLSKLLDQVGDLTEAQASVLISSLWSLEKQIDEDKSGAFDFDNVPIQVIRTVYFSLSKAVVKSKRAELLKRSIEKVNNIYYPTRFISTIEGESKKETGRGGEPLLSELDIDGLKSQIIQRIEVMAESDKLIEEDNFIYLLFRWKEWGSEDKVRDYIGNLIKEKPGLLIFLRKSVNRVLSTAGDYDRISKKSINQLYPIEEVEKLVAQITNREINDMTDEDKKAVSLFRNPVKDDWEN